MSDRFAVASHREWSHMDISRQIASPSPFLVLTEFYVMTDGCWRVSRGSTSKDKRSADNSSGSDCVEEFHLNRVMCGTLAP